MKMNVIATTVSAWVLEPTYTDAREGGGKVGDYSESPVIAWRISDNGHPHPITCTGEPEGHFMIRFGEKKDFEGHVYIPATLEVLSPWVAQKDGGIVPEGVSPARIVEKFREMRHKALGVKR
jgi:hypothetical protein